MPSINREWCEITREVILEAQERINAELTAEGRPPFQFKTIPQGAATSVWAGVVAPADAVGGRYCENCHVGEIVPGDRAISAISEGVRAYALDPEHAEALWAKAMSWWSRSANPTRICVLTCPASVLRR